MHILNVAEKQRCDSYYVAYEAQNVKFNPLAFSASGGFGKTSDSSRT